MTRPLTLLPSYPLVVIVLCMYMVVTEYLHYVSIDLVSKVPQEPWKRTVWIWKRALVAPRDLFVNAAPLLLCYQIGLSSTRTAL